MIKGKKLALLPILESSEGIHLTIYLANKGNVPDLKIQLRDLINEAKEWLEAVHPAEAQDKLLEPVEALLKDNRILRSMKHNIGIFRNQHSFRVLNIPIEVEPSCQVASSFHVKPLLRWLQGDQDFLLLGLEKDSANLYVGSQHSIKMIGTIFFPVLFAANNLNEDLTFLKSLRKNKAIEDETFAWLNEWIIELTKSLKPKLFIAGEASLLNVVQRSIKYEHLVKTPVSHRFEKGNVTEVCQIIRRFLKDETNKHLEKSLQEFRFAEEENRTRKNIFQISKAVVAGRVRKLIVTDDFSIFGKIDPKSGGLAIHPTDLDHEDDCILDDLAQMVLSQGGEVVVAKRSEIPKGRPILAILEDDIEKSASTEKYQYQIMEERFG